MMPRERTALTLKASYDRHFYALWYAKCCKPQVISTCAVVSTTNRNATVHKPAVPVIVSRAALVDGKRPQHHAEHLTQSSRAARQHRGSTITKLALSPQDRCSWPHRITPIND